MTQVARELEGRQKVTGGVSHSTGVVKYEDICVLNFFIVTFFFSLHPLSLS